ncbi:MULTISPECIES: histone-like nucleoid-structuring protein Lsr2 [unclassified Gordonia (in: high G+C Gram-positive bacteria)]|jgi:YHS domain-containing protein|uniref:histone-like nucleoid-structuring protein Lsr2 n=1 Tax=Gordonia sp. VNQ95 TaxID=3156619 RepID=UPI0032B5F3F9
MAKVQSVQIVDDIDGKVLDKYETVRWAIDGKEYEFDTSTKHAQQFRDAVAKYLEVSRTADAGRAVAAKRRIVGGARSKEQTQAIRKWAVANGFEISDRGRIPANVLEAFEAAH